ncbi:M15 family metallopeptidase [Neobacillus kokaensis]
MLAGPLWKKDTAPDDGDTAIPVNKNMGGSNLDSISVVANPESIPVLVNKKNKLPENYEPNDLVEPDIEFIFAEKSDKRKMRAQAAAAIEALFAGALEDGVKLLGVSAYRSHATQEILFHYYVSQDGYEAAQNYSAKPGTSEHETGLAIDVTGGDGSCAAEDCFGGSIEAEWLESHAADYGFIIRYPKGKEAITGYQYEPWHLRYVGKKIAGQIVERGITLEEYYKVVQVSK